MPRTQHAGDTILARLRNETRAQHEKIERNLDLSRRLRSIESYTAYLARLYGFYRPFEERLRAAFDGRLAGLELHGRQKTALLESDLDRLGLAEPQRAHLPFCQRLPTLESVSQALGCLYVLEGSTLGGQIIVRLAAPLFAGQAAPPVLFLASYGARVGEMWRAFCSSLGQYAEQDFNEPTRRIAEDQICDSALETFTKFDEWLSRDGA